MTLGSETLIGILHGGAQNANADYAPEEPATAHRMRD